MSNANEDTKWSKLGAPFPYVHPYGFRTFHNLPRKYNEIGYYLGREMVARSPTHPLEVGVVFDRVFHVDIKERVPRVYPHHYH